MGGRGTRNWRSVLLKKMARKKKKTNHQWIIWMSFFDAICFLGTSAGAPTRDRNTSCIGFRLQNGRCFLVDCGEATQHTLLRRPDTCPISLSRIDGIFLTHLHGDHCFGIFGKNLDILLRLLILAFTSHTSAFTFRSVVDNGHGHSI